MMNKKLAIGCDHGGVELKNYLISKLEEKGYELIDCGTYTTDSVHYPIYSFKVAELVSKNECEKGIIICRSGEGVSIAANKVKGIRCGIAYNNDVSRLMVEHNNANMIALGADFTTKEEGLERVLIFLNSSFAGGKHQIRVNLISDYENKH